MASRLRLPWLSLVASLLVGATLDVGAQSPTEPAPPSSTEAEESAQTDAPEAEEEDGSESPPPREKPRRLEPWMKQQILDKPRIAKETRRRLVGLRESGNPHVVQGSALQDAEYPAPMSEEERKQLRERQLQVHSGGRTVDWGVPDGVERNGATPVAAAPVEEPQGFPWANLMALAVAGIAGFLVLARIRRDALGE